MRREMHGILLGRIEEFLNRFKHGAVLPERIPLKAEVYVSDEPVPFARRCEPERVYRPVKAGEEWGQTWQSAWFRIRGLVPESWSGRDVVARLQFGGEALVFDADGCPIYGLTNHSVFAADAGKDIMRLFEPARGGEQVDLWVEAAANNLFGIHRNPNAERDDPVRHGTFSGRVGHLDLCTFLTDFWRLWIDMTVLLNLRQSLNEDDPRAVRLLLGLSEALDTLADRPENAALARQTLSPLFEVAPNPADLDVLAVGHAHIDTGWLWPVRESIRKSARTFASQIALLERYPEYVFGASQPQHYAFVKDHYPALYEKIRAAVKAGRWECQGGMWVEADCNLTSGESLVRQLLHGKNFYMDEFGVDVRNCWIPDVFGYSAALPQILRRAGVDVFLTQKLSWNKHNTFPHNTFQWQGIDGSTVITHFPPENNYNSSLRPSDLVHAQRRFRENGSLDRFVSLFGIGDGGGGPREEHVENGLRMRSLNGCPRVRFSPAQRFFEDLRDRAASLERWVGELYLEVHRATLTTQARTKKGNRRLELRLRETEMLLAHLPAEEYPRAELDRIWKLLLINQFHDILPGSSIRAVYEQTEKEYAEGLASCQALAQKAAASLFQPDEDALLLFNSLSRPFTAPVHLPSDWHGHDVADDAGKPVNVQHEPDGAVVARVTLPALGFTTLRRAARSRAVTSIPAAAAGENGLVLENEHARYEFQPDGTLTSIYSKAIGREFVPKGARANLFSLYVDRPHNWDAWDIDLYYENQLESHAAPIAREALCHGPIRTGLRFKLSIGDSRIEQRVSLAADSARLDFETTVEWRETHKMLRVAFPTSVQTAEARFDIQYGYLKRPTHRNTSWDMARFESVAHRYVDLADLDGGLALLNDCKYGHKVLDGTIDLNLLRAPTEPDPDADIGTHVFTYSLLPHAADPLGVEVMDQAAMLNQPPMCLPGWAANKAPASPVMIEGDGVSLEVLKRAEKTDSLVIRLVERYGKRSRAVLRLREGARLMSTDLMEWNDGEATRVDGPMEISLEPFEIRTLKLL